MLTVRFPDEPLCSRNPETQAALERICIDLPTTYRLVGLLWMTLGNVAVVRAFCELRAYGISGDLLRRLAQKCVEADARIDGPGVLLATPPWSALCDASRACRLALIRACSLACNCPTTADTAPE